MTNLESRCARCGADMLLHPCAQCTFLLCPKCYLLHTVARMGARRSDTPAFCDQVADYAGLHAMFRREHEWFAFGQDPPREWFPSSEDWQAARRAYASSLWRGPVAEEHRCR